MREEGGGGEGGRRASVVEDVFFGFVFEVLVGVEGFADPVLRIC